MRILPAMTVRRLMPAEYRYRLVLPGRRFLRWLAQGCRRCLRGRAFMVAMLLRICSQISTRASHRHQSAARRNKVMIRIPLRARYRLLLPRRLTMGSNNSNSTTISTSTISSTNNTNINNTSTTNTSTNKVTRCRLWA